MSLAEFSVKRRVTISMIVAIILVIGAVAYSKIGFDLLPEMEFPSLFIMTQYSGVAPEDIEALVTEPVEMAVSTVKGVKKLSSFCQEGVSVVTLDMVWGTNLDVAAQDVRNAISLVKDYFPADVKEPLVMKFSSEMMPVNFMAVTSEAMNTYQLRKLMRKVVKPRLEKLDGVAAVQLVGGEEREIFVKVDAKAMEGKKLSLADIAGMLRAQNLNLPGGHIEEPHYEFLVRSIGEYRDLDDIRNTVVGMGSDGGVVRLKEVAEVTNESPERRDFSRIAGTDGVMLLVSKQSGSNAMKTCALVKAEVEAVKKILPAGVRFHDFFDQGELIGKATSRTASSALYGAILAVIMILLFLRDPRPTLAIGIAIPLSILAAFIPIYFLGYTLNMMTLAGFALGVGMLVDNAIVVIENVFRHLELGKDRRAAAIAGTSEVNVAITASTLTTVVVFVPMIFAEGIPGQIAKALASTVSFSLLGSLFVALTIVPMLASVFFGERGPAGEREAARGLGARMTSFMKDWKEGKGLALVKNRLYEPLLRRCLRHRAVVVAAFLALFALSVGSVTLLGTEFMPKTDQPFISMEMILPVGTNVDETLTRSVQIEQVTSTIPEITEFSAFGGLSEATKMDVAFGTMQAGTNFASIGVKLKDKAQRARMSDQVIDEIRARVPKLDNVKYNFPDMNAQMFGMGSEKPVSIRLYGDDLEQLKAISGQIVEMLRGVKGVKEPDSSLTAGLPEIGIRIDREKAGSMGLPLGLVAAEVQGAMQGVVATEYRKGGEEFNVRVRLRDDQRRDEEDIRAIPIKTPLGSFVRLGDIAAIERATGAVRIDRLNQMRVAKIGANTGRERDLGSITAEVKQKLAAMSGSFPEGYFTELGGEYERMMEYFTFFIYALILSLILVYMVMAAQFESFAQPLIIMLTVPLCLIGVFLLLFLTGTRFNVTAGLGVIILIGIAVNNGIILVDYTNRLVAGGMEVGEAIVEGAKTRLRPIFITVGTTIMGMLPMAFDRSEGAEMRAPLAYSIIGGLLTSTSLTLLLVPTLYSLLHGASARLARLRRRGG